MGDNQGSSQPGPPRDPLGADQFFKRLFDNSLDGMIIADDLGRYLDANPAASALLGYPRDKLLRMRVADLTAVDAPNAPERYATYLRHGREQGEFPFIRGDGELGVIEYSAIRLGPDLNFSVLREISARKRMERDLRESEERFRQLAHSIYRVFWLVSVDYRQTLYVNPQHETVFGQPLAAIYEDFRAWLAVVHPEDRADVTLAIERYREASLPGNGQIGNFEIEYRIIKPDGKVGWLKTALFPVHSPAGQVYRHGGLTRDVTREKQMVAALAAAEQNVRTLVESSLDGIAVLDGEHVVFANRKMLTMLGSPELNSILGRPLREYVHVEDQPLLAAVLARYVTNDCYLPPPRLRLLGQGNRSVEVELTLVRVQFNGRPAAMAVLHDMADRTQARVMAEAMAAERTSRLQIDTALQKERALQAITDALLVHSDETRLLTELAERVRALLAADCAAVYRIDEDATALEAVALTPLDLGSLPSLHAPLGNWVWQVGETGNLTAATSTDATELLPRGFLPTAIIRLTPPGGTAVGLLVISRAESPTLSEGDLQMLTLIGERVGSAIERSRLCRRLQQGEARLRLLSRQIVEAQERERQHIARELHDEIGQLLTALSLRLQHCSQQAPPLQSSSIAEAQALSRELLNRVRQISLTLRPPMLDDLGLLPALTWHLERVRELTQVQVRLTYSGIDRRFSPELEIAIYRIVQEAVTNVVRHAGVREAVVRLWASSTTIAVQIVDQGSGFDPQASMQMSAGLLGMQERVALLEGHFTRESAVGAGTCITAEFPLQLGAQGGRV